MKKMFSQLLTLMERQSKILSEMIESASEKTQLLAKNRVDEINQMIEKEQELEVQMAATEKQRGIVVGEIGAVFNVEEETIKISDILKYIDEPFRTDLNKMRYEIQKKIDELKEISELNLSLIHNIINYVEFMISMVSGQSQEHTTYGSKGNTNKEKMQSTFDNKA